MSDPDDEVRELVERLRLAPHPEGGYYRETYRSPLAVEHPGPAGGADRRRPAGTAIYFLLAAGDFSAFHRLVGSDEVWHLYAGGPLELHLLAPGGGYELRRLASDLAAGEPQAVVEAGSWQAARPAPGARWALCGCTVAPGFSFDDFEMPPAAELLRAFPAHRAVVRELTRR